MPRISISIDHSIYLEMDLFAATTADISSDTNPAPSKDGVDGKGWTHCIAIVPHR